MLTQMQCAREGDTRIRAEYRLTVTASVTALIRQGVITVQEDALEVDVP